ncbi:MAG: ABC transporter substrate-binding protein [Actinomycetota bacterium]
MVKRRALCWHRILVGMVAVAILGMGCAADDGGDETGAESTASSAEDGPADEADTDGGEAGDDAADQDAATDEADDGSAAAEVTLADATGTEVTVPVTDQGVYALDGAVAIQLLALGVVPDAMGTWIQDLAAQEVAAAAGTELLDYPGNEPPMETIAAGDPQLILGVGHPFNTAAAPQLQAIAPTFVIDFGAPWQEQLRAVGDATGRAEEAEVIITRIAERTAEVAVLVEESGRAGESVSIIGNRNGAPVAFAANSLAHQILAELGFTRPEPQDVDGTPPFPAVLFSEEQLADHEADIVVEMTGDVFGPDLLTESPLLDTSDSEVALVYGQPWGTSSPLGAWTILTDVERLLAGEPLTTADDGATLFAELTGR